MRNLWATAQAQNKKEKKRKKVIHKCNFGKYSTGMVQKKKKKKY